MRDGAVVSLGLALGKQPEVGDLGGGEQRRRAVGAGRHAGAAADALRRRPWRVSDVVLRHRDRVARPGRCRSAPRCSRRPAMIRSKALRSTTRSFTTGKARGPPGLDRDLVAVLEAPHVELAGRRCPASARAATPLIIRPHVPQIPSRQSWSKAIGSSPARSSRSLTTSSISRNDMSGLMSCAS